MLVDIRIGREAGQNPAFDVHEPDVWVALYVANDGNLLPVRRQIGDRERPVVRRTNAPQTFARAIDPHELSPGGGAIPMRQDVTRGRQRESAETGDSAGV